MQKNNFPVTPAIRFLRQNNISFSPFQYEYEAKGGTKQTATELNVDEHSVIKTLVFQTESSELIVLMHGDLEVSTKELARILNVKTVTACSAETATKATGYQFGGTSPFGTRKNLPVYAAETIFNLDNIYINGGKQGFILKIDPNDITKLFNVTKIKVGIKK